MSLPMPDCVNSPRILIDIYHSFNHTNSSEFIPIIQQLWAELDMCIPLVCRSLFDLLLLFFKTSV